MTAAAKARRRFATAAAVAALALATAPAPAQGLLDRIDRGAEPAAPADPYGPQDDNLYRSLSETGDAASLRRFIELYPESPHVPEAEATLAAIEREAEARRRAALCDGRWPSLEDSCDGAAIESFVDACPDDPFIRRAKLRLKGIRLGMLCKEGTATAAAPPAEPAPVPTPDPEPAPVAAPTEPEPAETEGDFAVAPASGTFYVRRSSNIRSGPSTAYPRRAVLAPGTQITATGRTENGWMRFDHEGQPAFIAGSLVQSSPVTAARAPSARSARAAPAPESDNPSPYQYRRPVAPAEPAERPSSGFRFGDLLKGSDFEPFEGRGD